MDPFGRAIDYLRISITDRCNERCLYCMPEGYRNWQRQADHLTNDEIARLVRVAAGLGFRKFRLTGGEPLVRPEVPELVRALSAIPGVECLGLSTNGTRLAALAGPLRAAGLRTVNVSLDALDPETYRRVAGGDVGAVLAGIRAAVDAGFDRVKLNCVLMRHVNEGDLWPLVQFAAEHQLPLRLIELMPVSRTHELNEGNFLSALDVMRRFEERDELVPQPRQHLSFGPARYYWLRRTGVLVGFIGAMSNCQFCETCNRIRLTADGKIRPCLGNHGEVDLLSALRNGADDAALTALFQQAMAEKPKEHHFRENYAPARPMVGIGG